MDTTIKVLQESLSVIRTGRASPGMLRLKAWQYRSRNNKTMEVNQAVIQILLPELIFKFITELILKMKVEIDGKEMPISKVASVALRDPQTFQVTCFDESVCITSIHTISLSIYYLQQLFFSQHVSRCG